ncbi:MAG: 4-hydroxy-tetrahydrodipicolinate reductase [Burkholderia sp.]|nr:4-hydroxy-tetrahydrodipicolinate reductase [Burkholderia sp.]
MKIAIAGASGRMGRILIEAILKDPDMKLTGVLSRSNGVHFGQDAGLFLGKKTGIMLTNDIDAVLSNSDYLIDFTNPESTIMHVKAAQLHKVRLVIGTTGFSDEQKLVIKAAANNIGIVLSPNMSVGVNIMVKLIKLASKHLANDYDIEIIEKHHRYKIDAPSGTALMMGEVIATTLGRSLKDCAVYSRHGITRKRNKSSIGFSTIRGGDIVGDHTVLFAGTGERIEITHKSSSRMSYAYGALRAVRFLSAHRSGLYDMQDVLSVR